MRAGVEQAGARLRSWIRPPSLHCSSFRAAIFFFILEPPEPQADGSHHKGDHMHATSKSILVAALLVGGAAGDAKPAVGPPPAADMQVVLDKLMALGAKPLETLTPEQARSGPSAANAAKAVATTQAGKAPSGPAISARDVTYPGAAGPLPARIYAPAGTANARPLIVYFHGGGWVIADIDTYDGGARGIARETGAVVVSCEYRRAPENKFPAAHDDAVACYKWATANAASWGAGGKVAIAGESAGGNLAIDTGIAARDQKLKAPSALLLVYPIAGSDMNTPSYRDSANAAPLSKAGMMWFVKHVFAKPADARDPRIDVYKRARLQGLPPTIIINGAADPLRSDGELLAGALTRAGVETTRKVYPGTTHEFFGMDAVVANAKAAQVFAGSELKKHLR